MSYKRILTIQDISCVGQCSMTVALPVLSACGHETCVLPTALLSTHTGGFGKPAIVTDTHCIRLVNRMGLLDGIKEPKKVEMELWKIIPGEKGSDFCHRLVYHGREVCSARKANCSECCLQDICKQVL